MKIVLRHITLILVLAALLGFKNDTLINMGDKRIYYKAIRIEMPACLQCHGTKEDISPETLSIIRKKYPTDRATGFKMGDYRATWKLVFE